MSKHSCPQCSVKFVRKYNRDRHVLREHSHANLVHTCDLCSGVFRSVKKLKEHRMTHVPSTGFEVRVSAFKRTCVSYRKTYGKKMKTLEQAFQNDKEEMFDVLRHELNSKKYIKAAIIWHAEFLKPLEEFGGSFQRYVVCLRGKTQQINNKKDIQRCIFASRMAAETRIDDFVEQGSGWVLDELLHVDIEVGNCPPLNGCCNLLSIRYLKTLQKVKPSRGGNTCFVDAVAFHFVKSENKTRLKKFIDKSLNLPVSSPVKVSQIPKFERDNAHLDLGINVIYAEGKHIYPLTVSKKRTAKENITLILYKTVVKGKVESHYAYVEKLDLLLRRTYVGGNGKLSYERSHHCPNCFSKFSSLLLLNNHQEFCYENKPQRIRVPQEGDVLQFLNHRNKFPAPYIGFFDFETSQEKVQECPKCPQRDDCTHKTRLMSEQKVISHSVLLIESRTRKVVAKRTYSGVDAVQDLLKFLLDFEPTLIAAFNRFPEYQLKKEDKRAIRKAKLCHICETSLGEDRVGDHCHVYGNFVGVAHNSCNLNRQVKKEVPLMAHNFCSFDGHFIVKALDCDERITCLEGLPFNSERFRTIRINSFLLMDSLSFLQASLGELVSDLAKNEDNKFKILDQTGLYKKSEPHKKRLLLRKGVFPYQVAVSLEALRAIKEIPPIEDFYSSLSDSSITEEDHKHAKLVFSTFGCSDLEEYMNLYCLLDTALLCEVMIQFRETIQDEFNLDCW